MEKDIPAHLYCATAERGGLKKRKERQKVHGPKKRRKKKSLGTVKADTGVVFESHVSNSKAVLFSNFTGTFNHQ